ncbi:MAG: type II toxin-antitoxin system RelE/ParE family toxin [Lachnospiraceae bacterium]|nr:type II toxin-antitoxin system RelE/ParE family toxin [Lachnospiraceae bacterium]
MSYRIEYTSEARQDLRDIYTYIAEKLMVPETAAGQVNRIMDVADGLTEMPFRFSLYEFEPWRSQGLRFVPVDNFILFYQLKKEAKTVYIVRIMYGGRDIRKQFEENLRL